MIRKNIQKVLAALLLATLLAACESTSSSPAAESNTPEATEASAEEATEITVSGSSDNSVADENHELPQEIDESTDEETDNSFFEETIDEYSTTVKPEVEKSVDAIGYSEESDIQIGAIGEVEMTELSGEESRAFEGKEMIADPDYLEQAHSSDVYYCVEPLDRIEVHPIEQWAEDFSSYTISEEVLGTVESTEAEEPFRIFDVYPEGIPINCVVFYLEDGTCGSFSLGYNGSGKKHVWSNALYKNFASMEASHEKDLEEGAVNWVLDLYRDLVNKKKNGESVRDYVHQQLLNGWIPSFGELSTNYDGEPMYYSSESHFVEVCGGAVSNIGMARIDLDKDGTDELIIGSYIEEDELRGYPTTLYAAYSVKGGKIQTIFQGWTRSFYHLADDGSIIHGGSNGALDYSILKYDLIEDDEGRLLLKETESVIVDGFTNPEKPYFYYPEGREVVGFSEDTGPIYSYEKVEQMDEETGRKIFNRIADEEIHVDLERIDLQYNLIHPSGDSMEGEDINEEESVTNEIDESLSNSDIGKNEQSEMIDIYERSHDELIRYDVLGCTFSSPGDWCVSDDEDIAWFWNRDDDEDSIDIEICVKYRLIDIPDWNEQYDLFLQYLDRQGVEITDSGLYSENGLQGYFAEYQGEYFGERIKAIEYVFNANNKGTVHIDYTVPIDEEFRYLDEFYTIIDTLDVSDVPLTIEDIMTWYEGYSEEEMQDLIKEDKKEIEKAYESHEILVW